MTARTHSQGSNIRQLGRYQSNPSNCIDNRHLVNARKEKEYPFEYYTQVFANKHGYINNLSILDLLFNEGTNAVTYLKSQSLQVQ